MNISLIPSPISDNPTTIDVIASPGNKVVHHIPVDKLGSASLRS